MFMERAVLKKVVLENFMCYAHAEFDFYAITKIMAKNGKGKSTIATAYLWCLFNCDYELKDNPVVRREVDGVSVDDMDTSVELTLDVDGKEITMKKVQKRTYSKDDSSYKDDNKYFINDVPKTLKDFNAYLDVDMNVFKMCSNVNTFLNQKPAEMREYLFGLVGNVTDLDIASQKAELAELVPLLNKYTVEELSAMNKATKSKITKDLPILDGQIKEKERDIQLKQVIEVSDLELQKNSLKEQIADCVAKQTDNDKLMAEYDNASANILSLKFELDDIRRKANEENIKARRDIENKISDKQFLVRQTEKTITDTEKSIEYQQNTIDSINKNLQDIRNKWKAENERKFDEASLICPYCKQEYPEDKKEQLRADFDSHKAEELKTITYNGNLFKDKLDKNKKILKDLQKELPQHRENLEMLNTAIADLEKQLAELPQEIDVTATEEYKALEQQIAEKEEAMHKANDISAVKAELKTQKTALRQQLAECESQIAKSDTAADEQRLEELKQTRIDSEQNKANAEKILDLLDELDKAKNEALTEAVNSHFGLVKWQLFEYAKNGNYKSCCIPTVDGKSILTTMSNKGNRILGRVDICNSIQKISGISVPIILDDSESLDEENRKKVTEMVDSQLIMLIVNDSEKLEIVEG
jgi:DNA repair exonuclease SbcCD ATPase subunit|uniref:Chromosome partition protein n=1 Tax=Siphoviridae sp. ctnMb19 TaxID=2825659 RepID=A0A8S5NT44_9CAUD|nr:MAG TPA: chromosome partition protein [Siphoviridae sp. ctnMb19]